MPVTVHASGSIRTFPSHRSPCTLPARMCCPSSAASTRVIASRFRIVALSAAAGDWLTAQKVTTVERYTIRSADMRYVGQEYSVTVPISRRPEAWAWDRP